MHCGNPSPQSPRHRHPLPRRPRYAWTAAHSVGQAREGPRAQPRAWRAWRVTGRDPACPARARRYPSVPTRPWFSDRPGSVTVYGVRCLSALARPLDCSASSCLQTRESPVRIWRLPSPPSSLLYLRIPRQLLDADVGQHSPCPQQGRE